MKAKQRSARLLAGLLVFALFMTLVPLAVVPVLADPTELFFSEYIEGSSYNKAVEIYNGTGSAVDLAAGGYSIEIYFGGNPTAGTTVALTGAVADGDVYVVADDGANAAILTQADQTSTSNFFNGDDAVVLKKGSVVVDAIGQVGFDPGSQWGSGDQSTADNTLRRMDIVCEGDPDEMDVFDPSLEWDGFAQDTFDGLGAHTTSCGLGYTPIYDIQYTTDPSGDSPLVGQVVTTEGIVYAVYGGGFFIADDAGAWHGVYIYNGGDPKPAVGDAVWVTGKVTEFHGLTQLAAPSYPDDPLVVEVLSSGNAVHGPWVVTSGDIQFDNASSEPYEGVFVEVHDLTVTAGIDSHGIWSFTDAGSGTGKADDWGYHAEPAVGDEFAILRGALAYDWSEYKVMPRDENDLVLGGPPITPIYDIQYTTDPSGDSPLVDQAVTTEGIVYAVYGGGFFIADDAGAWHGVYIYNGGDPKPAVGDAVRVTGKVTEFHGLTQLAAPSYPDDLLVVEVLSSGNAVHGPWVVTSGDIQFDNASSEPYEGVFVEVHDLTVTAGIDSHGIWSFTDAGSGTGKADDWGYHAEPAVGDEFAILRGALAYDWSEYKVMPRDENDLVAEVVPPALMINEVDSDTPSYDDQEFIELYDGGVGNTALDGLVMVLHNGSDDASYGAFDLDSYSTDADGYFVIGSVAEADLYVAPGRYGWLQNGADAVALYSGEGIDFPIDTAVTTNNLLDALVYDTDDGDDGGLLALLNAGQPQVNEAGGGDKDNHSSQRCPNGAGGARNTDTYTQKPPTPGAENSCDEPPSETCDDPFTTIPTIQDDGLSSPLEGQIVSLEGVVTGDFQGNDELDGFFVQDPNGDDNTATSDGIFVFAPGSEQVAVGDRVRVRGTVHEYNEELTQIHAVTLLLNCGTGSIAPTVVDLPVAGSPEPYEGMLVTFPEDLTASQNYWQGRYGQVTLSSEGRLYQPTNLYLPPSQEAVDLADLNLRRMIILDDGMDADMWGDNPAPIPYIGAGNTLRAGDTVAGLTGVIDYGQITAPPDPLYHYRLHPTGPVDFTRVNQRTAAPEDVGGVLKIASFNVLNYFNGDGLGGGFPTSRGADTPEEFDRQRTKIISAILAMDADVIGLMEIENDGYEPNSAIADLVNGLNDAAGAGTYAFIDPGVSPVGTDEIAVGFIYRPASVSAVGAAAILDSSVDPAFQSDYNRPAIAQTFERSTGGGRFTAVVNHLKSKGSPCDVIGDPDMGDGQGNCNLTRTAAATALTNWLATGDPTGSGDPDFFIIGDLNAYAMEDPITAIKSAGYTNLVETFVGTLAYSYTFDGLAGYLDHSLASPSATPQVSGTTVWHINTDEPSVIDYNLEYKPQDLFAPTPYRASDRDPVIVGFCEGIPPTLELQMYPDTLWPANHKYTRVAAEWAVSDNLDPTPTVTLVSVTSNEPDDGLGDGDTPNDIVVLDNLTFDLRAERSGTGDGRIYTITYRATDDCGNSTEASATVTVPKSQGKK